MGNNCTGQRVVMTLDEYMVRAYQALTIRQVIVDGPVCNKNNVKVEEHMRQKIAREWEVPSFNAMKKSLRIMYAIYATNPDGIEVFLKAIENRAGLEKKEVQEYVFAGEGIYDMGANPYASMRYIFNEMLGCWEQWTKSTIFYPYRWPQNKADEEKLELLKSAEKKLGIRMGIYPENEWKSPEEIESQMKAYTRLAYAALAVGTKKMPSETDMKASLEIMFVIHNCDKFGYTTTDEFLDTLEKVTGNSRKILENKVLGDMYSGLYRGLRIILGRYAHNLENTDIGDPASLNMNWYCYGKSKRYDLLRRVEAYLYRVTVWISEHSEKS